MTEERWFNYVLPNLGLPKNYEYDNNHVPLSTFDKLTEASIFDGQDIDLEIHGGRVTGFKMTVSSSEEGFSRTLIFKTSVVKPKITAKSSMTGPLRFGTDHFDGTFSIIHDPPIIEHQELVSGNQLLIETTIEDEALLVRYSIVNIRREPHFFEVSGPMLDERPTLQMALAELDPITYCHILRKKINRLEARDLLVKWFGQKCVVSY